MSADISPENELFIQQAIRDGYFQTRAQALEEAVELLKRRVELRRQIDEGIRQLDNGEGIELHGEEELHAFFEEIKAEGRRRYDAERKAAERSAFSPPSASGV